MYLFIEKKSLIHKPTRNYYNRIMINVAILGATGTVGQKFITLLENHPQFRINELVASEKSAGNLYKHTCKWKQNIPMSQEIANTRIKSIHDSLTSPILFSGLHSDVAYDVEKRYAECGHVVISNAKNHRMQETIPLVIPEVNHHHLQAITQQPYKGAIITNPNCSTIALALALAPLHESFEIQSVMVHTMQAISGAGYPGVPSFDMIGNIIPFISDEEEKIESETKKILGAYTPKGFVYNDIIISAHCNRIAVIDGHTECVSVFLKKQPQDLEEIIATWTNFSGLPQDKKLHMAPQHPIVYLTDEDRPQPQLDLNCGNGMSVSIGRLRKCPILHYKFVILGHNTIRGAAGAAILNAETALAMNLLQNYL